MLLKMSNLTCIFIRNKQFLKYCLSTEWWGIGLAFQWGQSLENAFLVQYEKFLLNYCPNEFKPVHYKRYV